MRKYRGREVVLGKLVEGDLHRTYPETVLIQKVSFEDGLRVIHHIIVDNSLQESIGQNDNEGNEIFVGDICEYGDRQWGYRGVVRFFVNEGCYAIDDPQGKINKYKRLTKNTIKKDNIVVVSRVDN